MDVRSRSFHPSRALPRGFPSRSSSFPLLFRLFLVFCLLCLFFLVSFTVPCLSFSVFSFFLVFCTVPSFFPVSFTVPSFPFGSFLFHFSFLFPYSSIFPFRFLTLPFVLLIFFLFPLSFSFTCCSFPSSSVTSSMSSACLIRVLSPFFVLPFFFLLPLLSLSSSVLPLPRCTPSTLHQ